MVTLTNLEDAGMAFSGDIFWDTLRPGLRLTVYGPRGCMTSVMKEVTPVSMDAYLIRTRNSSYLLTKNRQASPEELTAARTTPSRGRKEPTPIEAVSAAMRHIPRKLEIMETAVSGF